MENKRRVICLSTGCIDYAGEEYKKYDIDIVRLKIYFKDEEYIDGVNLDPYKFYKDLEALEDAKNNLPKTSVPGELEIREHFDKALSEGYDEVIVIVLSSYLSGCYSTFTQIGKTYEGKLKVTVVDSKTNSFNEGYLGVKAAQLIEQGVSTETIIKEINWIMKTQEFFGIDGKLDYLVYNGRLKGAKAFMGKMMSICPVVGFNREGVLGAMENVRTEKKALRRVCELIKEKIGDRAPEDYMLWHCHTGDSLMPMLKQIEKEYGIQTNHPPVLMSPVSGCHNGPWFFGYGLIFLRRDDEPLDD